MGKLINGHEKLFVRFFRHYLSGDVNFLSISQKTQEPRLTNKSPARQTTYFGKWWFISNFSLINLLTSHTPMTGVKKCQNLAETLKFLIFLSPIQTLTISEWCWRLRDALRIDTNRLWTGFSKLRTCKSENLEISKFGKDARRKMIEICLVKSASTSVALRNWALRLWEEIKKS